MDSILQYFQSLDLDYESLLKTGGILLLGTLLISLFNRFIFGKKSTLNNAVSSAIGILFIYALSIVMKSMGLEFYSLPAPLPYVTLTEDQLVLFSFANADYTVICSEVLSMIILAFLMNLVDNWLPRGKNVFTWLFFRILSIAIAIFMHIITSGLVTTYLPEGIITYAPTILLAILILMLLCGALKIPMGMIISTVNPLIAALYTFFFANLIGKQLTKAVLTTVLLTLIVAALQYFGVGIVSIAAASLIAYIPFVVILTILWYLVCHAL